MSLFIFQKLTTPTDDSSLLCLYIHTVLNEGIAARVPRWDEGRSEHMRCRGNSGTEGLATVFSPKTAGAQPQEDQCETIT